MKKWGFGHFMSITIVHSDVKKVSNHFNDYYLFSLALYSGSESGCNFMSKTILTRDCSNIGAHRFDDLNTYLFDFFEAINSLVSKKIILRKTKLKLANSLFFGILPFLFIKSRIDEKPIPRFKLIFNDFKYCINYWFFFFPLYFFPRPFLLIIFKNINLIKKIKNITK